MPLALSGDRDMGEVYAAGETDYSPDLLAQGIEEEPSIAEWREAALQIWEEDTQYTVDAHMEGKPDV